MSNEPNATKDQKALGSEADEDVLSLDTLDSLIAEQDPDFKDSMGAIAAEQAGRDANIELLDLDQLLAEEEARSLKAKFKRLRKRAYGLLANIRTSIWLFVTTEIPIFAKWLLARAKGAFERFREGLRQFGYKSKKFRLLVFAFIGLCLFVVTSMTWLLVKGVPEPERLFMQSLGEISEETREFDPEKGQELFYDSVRVAQNVLVITKLVVNLKRVASSGPNPMVAAELFVEGNSPEVVIEMKARETEVRDVFMRTMEDFNGADLETAPGKAKLLDRLAREANRLVTKGRVKKVYFKTFILNP